MQAGSFKGVPAGSDLFSLISLFYRPSRSAGTLAASRISSGTGDSLSIELFAEKGAFGIRRIQLITLNFTVMRQGYGTGKWLAAITDL